MKWNSRNAKHEKAQNAALALTPGNYTTVMRGVNRTTGIGLAETYKLDN